MEAEMMEQEKEYEEKIAKAVNRSGIGILLHEEDGSGQYNRVLIPANTPLPKQVKLPFATRLQNQKMIRLTLTRGDDESLHKVTVIGTEDIGLPEELPKNTKVLVGMELDEEEKIRLCLEIPDFAFAREIAVGNETEKTAAEEAGVSGQIITEAERSEIQIKSMTPGKQRRNRTVAASVERYFEDVVGMDEIKREISALYNNYSMTEDLSELGDKVTALPWNFFVGGEKGSGKGLLESILIEIMYASGMINTRKVTEISAITLLKNPEALLPETASDAHTVVVRNVEKLYQKQREDAGNGQDMEGTWLYIVNCLEEQRRVNPGCHYIFSGEREALEEILKQHPQLLTLVQGLTIPRYSADELYEIGQKMLKKEGFVMTEQAAERFYRLIKKESVLGGFANGYSIAGLINEAKKNVAVRYGEGESKVQLKCLQECDFILEDSVEESLEDLLGQLDALTGLDAVKKEVRKKIAYFQMRETMRRRSEKSEETINLHTLFMGAPGTGKTSVARLLGKIYGKLGILPRSDIFVETDRAGLIGKYEGHTTDKVEKIIEKAMGGILFIDEAYSLCRGENDPFGKEAVDTLMKRAEDYRDRLMIIMAGYEKEMEELLDSNPGMERRFPNKLQFENYSEEELYQIFVTMAEKSGYTLHPDSEEAIRKIIQSRIKRKNFGNAGEMRNIVEGLQQAVAVRLGESGSSEDADTIKEEDVQYYQGQNSDECKTLEACLNELDGMVGLEKVKKQVHDMIDTKLMAMERSKLLGKPVSLGSLHMVFEGNAGTGKTTVARLIGRIYGLAGLIKDGENFVEVSRESFVGPYMGHTERRAKQLVEEAMGGILFIDEAYDLVNGDGDSFGKTALNALIAPIENNREDLMVIMSGYQDKMQELFQYNQGLRSRMKTVLHFDDYSLDEMCRIFYHYVKENDYVMEPELEAVVCGYIEKKSEETADFANARGVRNCFEEVVINQAVRLQRKKRQGEALTKEDVLTLRKEDFTDGETE